MDQKIKLLSSYIFLCFQLVSILAKPHLRPHLIQNSGRLLSPTSEYEVSAREICLSARLSRGNHSFRFNPEATGICGTNEPRSWHQTIDEQNWYSQLEQEWKRIENCESHTRKKGIVRCPLSRKPDYDYEKCSGPSVDISAIIFGFQLEIYQALKWNRFLVKPPLERNNLSLFQLRVATL